MAEQVRIRRGVKGTVDRAICCFRVYPVQTPSNRAILRMRAKKATLASGSSWRKADDDHRKRGLVIRLFAIDTYPALFDRAISKQRKIRNDFFSPSNLATFMLRIKLSLVGCRTGQVTGFPSEKNRLVNVRLVVADSTECVEIRKDASTIDARVAVTHQPQPSMPRRGFPRRAVLSA